MGESVLWRLNAQMRLLAAAILLAGFPLASSNCIPILHTVWQDLDFYDIYTTVVPKAHRAELMNIIHQRNKIKNAIWVDLNHFAHRVKGIMITAQLNSYAHHNQQKAGGHRRVANSGMSPKAKAIVNQQVVCFWSFWPQFQDNIYNEGLSWQETCKRNNKLIMDIADDCLLLELRRNSRVDGTNKQAYINSYCMSAGEVAAAKKKFSTCTCGKKPSTHHASGGHKSSSSSHKSGQSARKCKPSSGSSSSSSSSSSESSGSSADSGSVSTNTSGSLATTGSQPEILVPLQPVVKPPDASNPTIVFSGLLNSTTLQDSDRMEIFKLLGQNSLSMEVILQQLRAFLQRRNLMSLLTELLQHQQQTIELQRAFVENAQMDSQRRSIYEQFINIDADQSLSFDAKCERKREIIVNVNGKEEKHEVEISHSCDEAFQ